MTLRSRLSRPGGAFCPLAPPDGSWGSQGTTGSRLT